MNPISNETLKKASRTLPFLDLEDETRVPVALISLPDMTERRELLRQRGIPEEWTRLFFEAVDMRNVDVETARRFVDKELFLERFGVLEGPASIGCALSHREAARALLGTSSDMMLVLEDDLVPRNEEFMIEIRFASQAFLNYAKSGIAFIVHLGVNAQNHLPYPRIVLASKRSKTGVDLPLFEATHPSAWISKSHAYLLSRNAALRIVQMEDKISTRIDWWRRRVDYGILDKLFYCLPCILAQDEALLSTIEDTRVAHEGEHFAKRRAIAPSQKTFRLSYIRDRKWRNRLMLSVGFRLRAFKAKLYSTCPYHLP